MNTDVRHVLVAGDVYDHATPSPRTRNQVVERMRTYTSVQWHLLPGNHDPYQPNGLWDQLRRRGLPDNIHAHTESALTILDENAAVLLPAPLHHRRTLNDPTAWMDDELSETGLIRIGFAHGAVYGFDTDEAQRANPIDPERTNLAQLDYLALGDWHGELKVNGRCWYSGTPGNRFVSNTRQGHRPVGRNRRSRRIAQGYSARGQVSIAGNRSKSAFENKEDVDLLEDKLRNLNGDLNHTLVDLQISGAISLADRQHFEERIVEGAAAALFHLRIDDGQLLPEPTDDDLDSIDSGGIVRAAADKLQAIVANGGGESEIARAALHRLYIEHMKLESGQ